MNSDKNWQHVRLAYNTCFTAQSVHPHALLHKRTQAIDVISAKAETRSGYELSCEKGIWIYNFKNSKIGKRLLGIQNQNIYIPPLSIGRFTSSIVRR